MKKYLFILDQQLDPIARVRAKHPRFEFLGDLIQLEAKGELTQVDFEKESLTWAIERELENNKQNPPKLPQYKKRFSSKEMYIQLPFKADRLEVAQVYENQILIVLLMILNSVIEGNGPHLLIQADNYREFRNLILLYQEDF